MIESNQTQMYDFGSDRSNENHYGQKTPPLYNVTGLFFKEEQWRKT